MKMVSINQEEYGSDRNEDDNAHQKRACKKILQRIFQDLDDEQISMLQVYHIRDALIKFLEDGEEPE